MTSQSKLNAMKTSYIVNHVRDDVYEILLALPVVYYIGLNNLHTKIDHDIFKARTHRDLY